MIMILQLINLTHLSTSKYIDHRLYIQPIIFHMTLRLFLQPYPIKTQKIVDLDQHEIILQTFDKRGAGDGQGMCGFVGFLAEDGGFCYLGGVGEVGERGDE